MAGEAMQPQNMDIATRMVLAVIDHWPFAAAILVAGRWVFPWALKIYFSNGGGDLMRTIVKSENEKQTQLYKDELDRRFKEHETAEAKRFAEGESRFRALEDAVDEITDSRTLKRRRRRA